MDLPDESSPVSHLLVTALAGVNWDPLTRDRTCEGFWLPNPQLITILYNPERQFYRSDEGDFVYEPRTDSCVVETTEA